MTTQRQRSASLAGWSLRAALLAVAQCVYSIFVIALASATLFAAYVATLDDIPVPGFIIREIRDKLQTQGIALRMQAIRFQPNGRIIIEKPSLYSAELDSSLVDADLAVAHIDLAHLLIGEVTLQQLSLSNGRLTLPALLSSSGLPQTALESIDFEAARVGGHWDIRYGNLRADNLQLFVSGKLKDSLLRPPQPAPDRRTSATGAILALAPRLNQLKQELRRAEEPSVLIELDLDTTRRQTARVQAMARSVRATGAISTGSLLLLAQLHETAGASLEMAADELSLPYDSSVEHLQLAARWDRSPSRERWQPTSLRLGLSHLDRNGLSLPSLLATIAPQETDHSIKARVEMALASAPLDLSLQYDLAGERIYLELRTELAPDLPEWLAPLGEEFAGQDLTELARLDRAVDLTLSGWLSRDFKPIGLQAYLRSGPLTLLGASVDQTSVEARVAGQQVDVERIRLRSGVQWAEIAIGYHLETQLRRILLEGQVDPRLVNGWFKPWWAAMWEGMDFPEAGMYTVLDSQAVFKRPETVRVTGIGHVEDMNLRSLPVTDLRTRFFSLFHYVDLYDIELTTQDGGSAAGSVQFALDRDHRDNKDKLVGLWIEADSTLDIKRGPQVLTELEQEVREILDPYDYDAPPRLQAKAASIRREDLYAYDVALDIQTDQGFRFHHFPFEDLQTQVRLENGFADIPFASAGLGGGELQASAFIVGDGIELEATVAEANFSGVLLAANAFLLASGNASSEKTDPTELGSYGGLLNARFAGSGYAGDPFSYVGEGAFRISDANLLQRRLLGPISRVLEGTPFMFTTLKFEHAKGDFMLDRGTVRFPEVTLDGPVAAMRMDGFYHVQQDALDLKARLFPFLNSRIPILSPLINITTQPLMSAVELSIRGPISDPRVSLFDSPSSDRANPDPRDSRPQRR